ncbi:S-methyl-5-thioribose kinase [Oleisolibacter albus]|uniref:S-methyl-5-thioribose kinase n=1 Tax=Oleisolibacter albus TaxID=2171757 RepID=UPI000DF17AFB|nr:S-methyl-5-thioribose kinase [Oleisolibacter albus]
MPLAMPDGYRILTEAQVPAFLAGIPTVAERLGGGPDDWRAREVGDGNMNQVFLVHGPAGSVCVKQALPYLRVVGEGWPLGLKRAWFEQMALRVQARFAPDRLPHLIHYDEMLFAIVMEALTPHRILRYGLVEGLTYPALAAQMGRFLAETLYGTSDLALPAREKKDLLGLFAGNWEMCGLTETVVFTEPYMVHPHNRWTSPQLDGVAAAVRADTDWKLAASRLKLKFLASPEALLHGDLHTGSIMVTAEDTRVIDPEFCLFGPIGFDIGALLGNLWLNALAQDGHAGPGASRDASREAVLTAAEEIWTGFRTRFLARWRGGGTGDAYPAALFVDSTGTQALEAERQAYLDRVFADALGFAGAKITRRILGISHNMDLESIADPDRRALCETRCLHLARALMVETHRFGDVTQVTAALRSLRTEVTRAVL